MLMRSRSLPGLSGLSGLSGLLGLLGLGVLLVVGYHVLQRQIVRRLEQSAIEVKRLGPETPRDYGAPFESFTVPVGDRLLQARLVRAEPPDAQAVLIFHGNGEALSDWSRVQAQLLAAGISSMVFDYSGFGDSTGVPSVSHLHEDGMAVYASFVEHLPQASRRVVLGHSLGNAVMLDTLPDLLPVPAGVIVHAGFTSAREMAVQAGLASQWLARLLPDLWNNQRQMALPGPPALVVHGEADEVIAPEMGLRLAHAAGTRATFTRLPGITHDHIFQDPTALEWQPMIDFIRARSGDTAGAVRSPLATSLPPLATSLPPLAAAPATQPPRKGH